MMFKLCVIFCAFLTSNVSLAQEGYVGKSLYDFSDFELSMLPDFCTLREDKSKNNDWFIKRGLLNLHHACKGINHLNKAIIHPDNKEYEAHVGIGELSYVLNYQEGVGLNDRYKAFILYNRARLFLMQKDGEANASADLVLSVKLNPKLTHAYSELISLKIKQKDKDEAVRFLREGLSNNVSSKLLLNLKKKYNLD